MTSDTRIAGRAQGRAQAGHRPRSASADLAEEIGDDTPLFGEGLGLDSIDVLELVLELERSFGVQIRDEETGVEVLRSIDTMADFVLRHRAAKPG